MEKFLPKPWLKALSGLCVNLSAAWFGVAFITPRFANLSEAEVLFVLTKSISSGIMFLLLTVEIEGYLLRPG